MEDEEGSDATNADTARTLHQDAAAGPEGGGKGRVEWRDVKREKDDCNDL
jgi:hypothetical protein